MNKICFIMIVLAFQLDASQFNSVDVVKNNNITKLMPELSGTATEAGSFGSSVDVDDFHLVIGSRAALMGGATNIYKNNAGHWELEKRIDTAMLPNISGLGNAVSVSGNRLLVGAYNSYLNVIPNSGAVLYYEKENDDWRHIKTITQQEPFSNAHFGIDVSLYNNTAVIASSPYIDSPMKVAFYEINDQVWTLRQELMFPDPTPNYQGHKNIKIDHNDEHLVVGQSNASGMLSQILIYEKKLGQWQHSETIMGSNGSGFFGNSLSLSGNRLVIGDWAYNSDNGRVHIYQNNGSAWEFDETLSHPEDQPDKEFGISLVLNGDDLLVGSYGDDENGGGSGAAFLFQKSNKGWELTEKLLASDGQSLDRMGNAVAINQDSLIVSAHRADADIAGTGQVYVYQNDMGQWQESQIISPQVTQEDKYFSNGMAIDDQWVIVGSEGDNDQGEKSGAIYFYRKLNGTLVFDSKQYADIPESDAGFGKKIVIQNDVMLVSAPGNAAIKGYVHYFKLIDDEWAFQAKFSATDTVATDDFGSDMSLDGNMLAVSARMKENGTVRGSVYFFEFDGKNWNESGELPFDYDGSLRLFGHDISLSNNRLIVGTWLSGSAFLFEKINDQWELLHELTQPQFEFPHRFGSTVELSGDHLIIGTDTQYEIFVYQFNQGSLGSPILLDDLSVNTRRFFGLSDDLLVVTAVGSSGGLKSGTKVFQWLNGSWQFIQELNLFGRNDRYFNDVSIFGNEVVIGHLFNDQRGYSNGAAYFIPGIGDLIFQNGLD